MRALADAVGVAVRVEARLKKRLDDVAQRVVDDAIAEGRGADAPSLGFVDVEVAVLARPVRAMLQFGL